MIDIKVKLHDRFSVEFKVGFMVQRRRRYGDFAMNMWIFVPNSLDINPTTYNKQSFYRNMKSHLRLITPHFALHEMGDAPLGNLQKAITNAAARPSRESMRECEHQIKMFGAIFKSAQRERAAHVGSGAEEIRAYTRDVREVARGYRALRNIPKEAKEYIDFGDEFLSNTIILRAFELLQKLGSSPELTTLIADESAHKAASGYVSASAADPEHNRWVVFRQGVLKKFMESDLYLVARRKKDGRIADQLVQSIAAGVSMIFATAVAFWGQRRFGSVATPLFFALVVSYMLKDRIKDVLRYYFAHSLSRRYFDHKTLISLKEVEIGWMKEAVDFVPEGKVPPQVMQLRNRSSLLAAENRTLDEKILLYRKLLHLDSRAMEGGTYRTAGINDILRLHFTRMMEKADNPETPIPVFVGGGNIETIVGERAYFVNIVLQMVFEGQTQHKRFRVAFTRDGIVGVEEI